jgi:hypothetical protein
MFFRSRLHRFIIFYVLLLVGLDHNTGQAHAKLLCYVLVSLSESTKRKEYSLRTILKVV